MPNLDQPLFKAIIKDKTPNITPEDKSRAEGMLEILSKSSPDVLEVVTAYLKNVEVDNA